MEYSLSHNDNVIHTLNLERVLSEVSKVLARPLNKSLTKKRSLDSLERTRHLPQDKNQPDDNASTFPHYTNYWLAQSDPNYVDQEETEATFSRSRRRSSQTPAEAVVEFLKNQPTVNQNDLRQALQTCLPRYTAPGKNTSGRFQSLGSSDAAFFATGFEMGISHNMTATCGPWINIDKAVKSCKER